MKYYVVIDTNVLVSAVLKSHSVPGSIVELAFDGPIIPILNEAIEKEYREVLSRPKFHLPEDLCILAQSGNADAESELIDHLLPSLS